MPYINSNNIQLYYEVYGEGETIIFLGGLGATCETWINQKPFFSKKFKVILIDNQGSGRSPLKSGNLTINEMVNNTILLMEQLNIKKSHFVTSSMGGFIGLEISANFPDKAISLTLINSSHKVNPQSIFRLKLWEEMKKQNVSELIQIKEQLLWVLPKKIFNNPQLLNLIISNMINFPYKQSLEGFSAQINACINFNGNDLLKKIKIPVLIFGAKDDLIIPIEDVKETAQGIKNSKYYEFDNSGHMIHLFKYNEVNDIILKFISNKRNKL